MKAVFLNPLYVITNFGIFQGAGKGVPNSVTTAFYLCTDGLEVF